jgi:O-antigen/teichoic acid export membrane protein
MVNGDSPPDPDPRAELGEIERRVIDRMEHPDQAQEREWLDQSALTYGALIGTAVLMVQPFLTAPSLDLASTISVIAFSVAIPLLSALILVSRQETFHGRRTKSILVIVSQAVGQGAAMIGLVAAFWHIHWIAGVGLLVSGFVAIAIHSAGFWQLELDVASDPEEPPV